MISISAVQRWTQSIMAHTPLKWDITALNTALEKLPSTEKFFINGEVFADGKPFLKAVEGDAIFMGDTAPFIKTPYPLSWIEVDTSFILGQDLTGKYNPRDDPEYITRAGFLVKRVADNILDILVWTKVGVTGGMWLPPLDRQMVLVGDTWGNRPDLLQLIGLDYSDGKGAGNIISMPLFHDAKRQSSEFQQSLVAELASTMRWVQLCLLMLSAKNVYLKKVVVPAKRNRKRVKKGKGKMYSHHILVTHVDNVQRKGNGKGNRAALALHKVRGTFAFYTKDRPLFGVPGNHGFIWKPEHTRGHITNGNVSKDYCVQAGR